MKEAITADTGQIAADLDEPVYAEILGNTLVTAPQILRVGVIDITRGNSLFRVAEGEPEDDAEFSVALARDLLGEGSGVVRRQFLSGRSPASVTLLFVDRQCLIMLPPTPAGMPVICVAADGKVGRVQKVIGEVAQAVSSRALDEVLAEYPPVTRGWLLSVESSEVVAEYKRPGTEKNSALAKVDELHPVQHLLRTARALCGQGNDEQIRFNWLGGVLLQQEDRFHIWGRVPFVPDHIVMATADAARYNADVGMALRTAANDVLRELMKKMLGSGLQTERAPRPQTDIEFMEIVEDLRKLDTNDLRGRLVFGGLADHPVGEGARRMRCRECTYFLPHRRGCDLPELPIPVEQDWFCRLWKR